jgi:tetratricopeptide (TPR) repeat protein
MPARDGLAAAQLHLGDLDGAIGVYQNDIRLYPHRIRSYGTLGRLLVRAGRYREAEAHLATAVEEFPEARYHAAMGEAAFALGRRQQALDLYRLALREEPDLATALRGAAWILATSSDPSLRDPLEAIRIARGGLQRIGEDAALLDALAAASADQGRYDEALEAAARAAALAAESGDQARADAIRERSAAYRMGRPHRE